MPEARGQSRFVAVVLSAVAVLAACAPDDPSSPSSTPSGPYEPPSVYARHSFVWDAPPDVDLLSPVMVVSRAFFESVVIVMNKESGGKTYPGYSGSTAGTQYPPEPDFQLASTDVRGTDYLSVLSLTTTGEDTTVVVCWDHSGTAQQRSDTTYEQGRLPHAEKLVLHRAQPDVDEKPVGRQEGQRTAPAGDVFDGWKATKFSRPISSSTWDSADEYDKYLRVCFKEHRHGPDVGDWLSGPPKVSPDDPRFAPKPPYPGWPEPGHV